MAATNEVLLISVLPDSLRNLSCLALYAVLEANHQSAKLLFMPQRQGFDEALFGEFLKAHPFDLVGISVTTGDFYFCRMLTAQIRKHLPQAHVVWGGIHPLSLPEECLDHADSICIGEGEQTLLRMLEAIRAGRDISPLPGIGTCHNGQAAVNPPPPLQSDLSAWPYPHYDFDNFYILDTTGLHRLDLQDYKRYSKHCGEDYTVMASRSCPCHCSFCINSFLNRVQGSSGAIRRRSVEHVLAEIADARSLIPTIGFINFIDDFFLTKKQWTLEFCEKYKERVGLPFMIRAVPNAIRDEEISLLKQAGLAVLQTGVQSGSDRVHRNIFNRSFDLQAVFRAAEVLKKHNVKPVYDFIIENDFEEDCDRDKTIELMLRLPQPYDVNLFVLTVFPKTDLEELYKKRNLKSRIDPYVSDYLDYKEDDFYYQLASLIPTEPHETMEFIFRNRNSQTRELLNELYKKKRSSLRNVRPVQQRG